MKDVICFITGGNSGIGKEAAIQFAKKGVKVIIACRNSEKAKAAVEEIKHKSNSENIDSIIIDMSSQKSIRNGVDEFSKRYSKLDILIHNAADFDISRKTPVYSDEGIETVKV